MITYFPVRDNIWLATAEVSALGTVSHPGDRRSVAGRPAWRVREFLAGRDLLRRLLAVAAPHATDAVIEPDARGKPWLVGYPGIGISVSHCAEVIAAGVAVGMALGVDVQRPDQVVSDGIVRRLLGTNAPLLHGMSPGRAAEEVAWIWTVQEACVKADGAGLAGHPWTIPVPPRTCAGRWGRFVWSSLRGRSPIPLSYAFAAVSTEEEP